MQDIRWNAFWLGLTLVVICLILWAVEGAVTALSVSSLALLIYLTSHIYWLHKLHRWLKKPKISTLPNGSGVWVDIFADLYHQQRRYSRSQTQLNMALQRFRDAASALPDGVVLLDSKDHIEWCNPPAESQLGLSLSQDAGQPINYLLRDTTFIKYLQDHDYAESIRLKSWRNTEIILEIKLVVFGASQKLLICRDISQLERIDTVRRDFIANVSHELRTPLTVVGGFLETLMDMKGVVSKSTRSYFDLMQDQTKRMQLLIEDLLTLSLLESGATVTQDTEINVAALLSSVMTEAQSLSNGRHHIILDADHNLALTGSMEELHSAFGNLVSNAIRYTPYGGDIALSWGLRNTDAVFSVKDSGIGIEPQHIERLTERFYRVDRSRSRETGGTGLGLSIVKHILMRHQAKLEIDSEPDKGSTFSAVFPKTRWIQKQ